MAEAWQQELADRLNTLAQSNPTMAAQTGVAGIGNVTAGNVQQSYDSGGAITGSGGYVPKVQTGQQLGQQFNYQQIQDMIKDMYAQQQASQLAKLKAAQQTKLTGLQNQIGDTNTNYQTAANSLNLKKEQAAPQYTAQRNQLAGANAISVQRLREAMAARGLPVGEQLTNLARLGAAYTSGMTDIGQSEQNFNNDVANQLSNLDLEKLNNLQKIQQAITDAQNAQSYEELGITGDIGAQQTQALINAMNTANSQAIAADNTAYERYRDTVNDLYKAQESSTNQTAADLANQLAKLKLDSYSTDQGLQNELLKAQIAATNRSNKSSSSSNPTQTEVKNYVISSALAAMKSAGDTQAQNDWLYQHKSEIIANAGTDAWDYLFNALYPGNALYQEVLKKQALAGY